MASCEFKVPGIRLKQNASILTPCPVYFEKTMKKRKVPRMTTDQEAEAFLERDLSGLDFAQFKPVRFEFEAKAARLNMRLPASLLDAVKARASARGVPYTRFIREALEQALAGPGKRRHGHQP
jgi:predicted DNA binding CopG/RHH family protein